MLGKPPPLRLDARKQHRAGQLTSDELRRQLDRILVVADEIWS